MIDPPLFILAGNGPYENRGCEAIIRGTVEILRKSYRNPRFFAPSSYWSDEQLSTQRKNESDDIAHDHLYKPIHSFTIPWAHRLMYKVSRRHFSFMKTAQWKEELRLSHAVLSVGGDNYTLDYGIPQMFTDLDDLVLEKNKPLIIWGASIGPFRKNPKYEKYMTEHLKRITALFIRETASIEYLRGLGITDNVYSVADPAFVMKPIEPPAGKINFPLHEGAVGLNISPLIASFSADREKSLNMRITTATIKLLADSLKRPIYLIPHVTIPVSNDYEYMKEALSAINGKHDIYLVPPVLTAQETKWLIGKMAFFAGARTHATIAAISQIVPKLTLAYSIKGVGINNDIFGNNDYCLMPDEQTPGSIVEKLDHLIKHSDDVKSLIKNKLPRLTQMAFSAGDQLRSILGD